LQKASVALYRDEIRPDMIGRHMGTARGKEGGRREETINSMVAQRVVRKFDDAFGLGGEKLNGMTFKYVTCERVQITRITSYNMLGF
jgi:hypothetical protein